jgi:hypothetical protein
MPPPLYSLANPQYSRSNPKIAAADRAILKANLKGIAAFFINLLAKLLPLILPLVVGVREADATGLTSQPPGSPMPEGTDPILREAIEAARRAN